MSTIPPDQTPNKALQDALDYACRLGRYQGGHEVRAFIYRDSDGEERGLLIDINRSRPFVRPIPAKVHNHDENCIHLNGDGLRGLKRDAAEAAIRKTRGNVAAAAALLGVSRGYMHEFVKRANRALPLLVLLLAGCATAPKPPSPIAARMRELIAEQPITTTQQASAAVPTGTVVISWTTPDTDPAIQFEIWASQDLAHWDLRAVVAERQATIQADKTKEFFMVRARDTETGALSGWATTTAPP